MTTARKFLVIADGSDESRTAAYFAARRARKTGGSVVILAAASMEGGFEHWLGVGDTMRAEAREAAEEALESLAEDVEGVLETRPELHLKEDDLVKAVCDLLDADEDIAILVIGARPSGEQPGAIFAALASGKGLFRGRQIPVTLVPGELSKEAIKALA